MESPGGGHFIDFDIMPPKSFNYTTTCTQSVYFNETWEKYFSFDGKDDKRCDFGWKKLLILSRKLWPKHVFNACPPWLYTTATVRKKDRAVALPYLVNILQ